VHSLVGEFLEHSCAVFIFGSTRVRVVLVFILVRRRLMERNLDRRVESWSPSRTRLLQAELQDAFEITWRDDLFTWALWHRYVAGVVFSGQSLLSPGRVQASGDVAVPYGPSALRGPRRHWRLA